MPGVDNEVYLRVSSAGVINLTIDGNATASTSAIPSLLDGKTHAIAVSWDNTNGDVSFYIDGQFVQTSTGIKAGITLAGGGTLVMGKIKTRSTVATMLPRVFPALFTMCAFGIARLAANKSRRTINKNLVIHQRD